MREILFRAKRADNGDWVEGYYFKMNETTYAFAEDYEKYPVPVHHYIVSERMSDWGLPNKVYFQEVDPGTVCQYVDFEDKDGKRIFENDICEMVYDGKVHTYVVVWDKSELDFKGTNGKEKYGQEFEYLPCCDEIVIIGNIFDTPELMK